MQSSAVDLPIDIIVEILSRASLKSLGKCRLLSNETNSLTYRSDFLNVHNQRTKTVRGFFFMQEWNTTFVSTSEDVNLISTRQFFDYLPDNLLASELVASTKQGILLYGKDNGIGTERKFVVCKPCTRQYLTIPASITKNWGMTQGIGLAVLRSNPLRFKIVLIIWTMSKSYVKRNIHVFDSAVMRWKLPQRISRRRISRPYSRGLILYRSQVPVSASGALYWITSTNTIFCYNVVKENWRLIKSPDSTILFTLVNYEGKLGLTFRKVNNIELWIYWKKLWTKRHSINIEPLIRKYTITGFCSSDVALVNFGEFFAFYNFKILNESTGWVDAGLEVHFAPSFLGGVVVDDRHFSFRVFFFPQFM
ncbi:hypothetical protein ACFE04_013495 [Oxalis oulophora]